MLKFNSSFFEDEVREGFYVSGIMKKSWAAQLNILYDISKLCSKYNITWYADFGTLLGAVRHKGFIPWDDDIDICMLREDYERFIVLAKRELVDYKIMTLYDEEPFEQLYSRVANSRCISFNEDFLNKNMGCPFPNGVDIFPIDYIAGEYEKESVRYNILETLYSLLDVRREIDSCEREALIEGIESLTGCVINRRVSFRQQLLIMIDHISKIFPREMSDEVTNIAYYINNSNYRCSKKVLDDVCEMKFENMVINVPSDYDSFLKMEFGDYMKIIKTPDHEYPFFEKYEKRYDCVYSYKFNNLHLKNDSRTKACTEDIIFFPFSAKYWHIFDDIWRNFKKAGYKVLVIPIPYYDRNMDGTFCLESMHYDINEYPEYLDCVDYKKYNLEQRRPCKIFIQNPYDECNYSTSVDPYFYASNIKKYTNELIYIPYFIMDEVESNEYVTMQTFKYFCTVPGVVHSDKVIVQSENMRKAYIDKLDEMSGYEIREVWEEKIKNGLESVYENGDI